MAIRTFFTLIVFIAYFSTPATCQTLDDSIKLMDDTLQDYDRRHRPVLDQSGPVSVNVTFDIVSIQDFNEVEEKFTAVGLLYLTWMDEKLIWDPSTYGWLFSQMYSVNDIWYPILILVNPADKLEDLAKDWMTIRVWANGYAVFVPGAVFKSTCSVDVTYYPFDTQNCQLHFVPWGFGYTELNLVSVRTDVLQTYFSENGEWTLGQTTASSSSTEEDNSIRFTFELKRKPLFMIINVILPIIFMAMINVLVFVLPAESGERMSYCITVLLAIAVFLTLVADNLPKTSTPMSILSYFLMMVLVLSTLMCVVAILNLRVYHKSEDIPVPRWCKKLTQIITCTPCKKSCKLHKRNPEQKTVVVPIDANFNEKNRKKDGPEVTVDEGDAMEDKVTWKDVSVAVDIIAVLSFLMSMVIVAAVFISIMAENKPVGT